MYLHRKHLNNQNYAHIKKKIFSFHNNEFKVITYYKMYYKIHRYVKSKFQRTNIKVYFIVKF